MSEAIALEIETLASHGMLTTQDIANMATKRLGHAVTEATVANLLAAKKGETVKKDAPKVEECLTVGALDPKSKRLTLHNIAKRKAQQVVKDADIKRDRAMINKHLSSRNRRICEATQDLIRMARASSEYSILWGPNKVRRTLVGIGSHDDIIVRAMDLKRRLFETYEKKRTFCKIDPPHKWSLNRWVIEAVDLVNPRVRAGHIAALIKIIKLDISGDRPWERRTATFIRPILEKDEKRA